MPGLKANTFKNKRTVARVKHIKNYKLKPVYWLYIVKTFELSAVRLQPSMEDPLKAVV